MGIDLRWFTGVRVPPSICFHEALGNWAQSQSLDRFGSKLGLRVGAPDLTGVGGYQRLWSLQYGGLPGCFRMDL